MTPPLDDRVAARVVDRLAMRFPRASRDHILTIVDDEYRPLMDSPIRLYLPNLIEHGAIGRLRLEARGDRARGDRAGGGRAGGDRARGDRAGGDRGGEPDPAEPDPAEPDPGGPAPA
ncbi:MAG TPA: hypothetical protein VGC18_00275 [Lacisediminihabitans sp.]|uniref:three-helix bundle dimerization domain-containing protein n=1 Tax=Lacisediminihabitans sp. TaxID=2787631 RepID=UPI002ED8BC58